MSFRSFPWNTPLLSHPIITRDSNVKDIYNDKDVDIETENFEKDSIKSLVSNEITKK